MGKKKDIIRVNSQVTIVNPIVVTRWGYPLTKKLVKETVITQSEKDAIHSFIDQFRYKQSRPQQLGLNLEAIADPLKDKTYRKLLDLMAYEVLCREGFGGGERQLFTLTRESLRGKLGQVVERKVVKTGKYYPPSGYPSSYYDDYDNYEPGGLSDEKTNVLFKVYVFTDQEGVCPNINYEFVDPHSFELNGVWIEKINLELPVLIRYERC